MRFNFVVDGRDRSFASLPHSTMSRYQQLILIFFIQLLYLWTLVESQQGDFFISGYLPEYRSYINVNASAIHLTDLILFSLTPETLMSSDKNSGCCVSSNHYELIRKARSYKKEKQHEALRLILAVGGAGRSNGFAQIMAGDLGIQERFVDELTNLCKRESLDGIDLDYEGIQSLDEWRRYLQFIAFAAAQLHNNGLLLSVAVHPGQFLPQELCERVDRIHVMTYDMIGGKNRIPGHHAELDVVKGAIEAFIDKGCRSSNIILGLPAYARHGQNPGLVQTYSEIMDNYFAKEISSPNNNYQSTSSINGYYFDSLDAVTSKVKYAKEIGLGGVFFWELGQDKQYSESEGGILLETAAMAATASENSVYSEL